LWAQSTITYDNNSIASIISKHGEPLIIFKAKPGKRVNKEVKKAADTLGGICATVAESGWMTEKIFLDFLDAIPTCNNNGWLVLDIFKAHRASSVINKIKAKGYTPLFIPGGCTAVAQVHDVYINRTFKQSITLQYEQVCINDKYIHINREHILRFVRNSINNISVDFISKGVKKLILDPAMKIDNCEDGNELETSNSLASSSTSSLSSFCSSSSTSTPSSSFPVTTTATITSSHSFSSSFSTPLSFSSSSCPSSTSCCSSSSVYSSPSSSSSLSNTNSLEIPQVLDFEYSSDEESPNEDDIIQKYFHVDENEDEEETQ
jgi:hypothetical protein